MKVIAELTRCQEFCTVVAKHSITNRWQQLLTLRWLAPQASLNNSAGYVPPGWLLHLAMAHRRVNHFESFRFIEIFSSTNPVLQSHLTFTSELRYQCNGMTVIMVIRPMTKSTYILCFDSHRNSSEHRDLRNLGQSFPLRLGIMATAWSNASHIEGL